MAKVVVCVGETHVVNDIVRIEYTASVIRTGVEVFRSFSYGSEYIIKITSTINNNLIAWRNKVIAQVAEKGVIVSETDVIVFGGPS